MSDPPDELSDSLERDEESEASEKYVGKEETPQIWKSSPGHW